MGRSEEEEDWHLEGDANGGVVGGVEKGHETRDEGGAAGKALGVKGEGWGWGWVGERKW